MDSEFKRELGRLGLHALHNEQVKSTLTSVTRSALQAAATMVSSVASQAGQAISQIIRTIG
jgi:hypothetical protein